MSHVTQVSCIPHTTSSAWAPKAHKRSHIVRQILATLLHKTLATLVPARAKHQARLNALPSAAESQQS